MSGGGGAFFLRVRYPDTAASGLTQIALRIYDDPAASIRLIGERLVPALADERIKGGCVIGESAVAGDFCWRSPAVHGY